MELSITKHNKFGECQREILKISVPKTEVDDRPKWHGVEVEKLTLRHVYNCLKDGSMSNTNERWRWIWKLEMSTKIHVWVWEAWHKALPTKEVLSAQGVKVHSMHAAQRKMKQSGI